MIFRRRRVFGSFCESFEVFWEFFLKNGKFFGSFWEFLLVAQKLLCQFRCFQVVAETLPLNRSIAHAPQSQRLSETLYGNA